MDDIIEYIFNIFHLDIFKFRFTTTYNNLRLVNKRFNREFKYKSDIFSLDEWFSLSAQWYFQSSMSHVFANYFYDYINCTYHFTILTGNHCQFKNQGTLSVIDGKFSLVIDLDKNTRNYQNIGSLSQLKQIFNNCPLSLNE